MNEANFSAIAAAWSEARRQIGEVVADFAAS
jgi:hypothetical protein